MSAEIEISNAAPGVIQEHLDKIQCFVSLWCDERAVLLTAIADLLETQERLIGIVPSLVGRGLIEAARFGTPAVRQVRGTALSFVAPVEQLRLRL